ncbi:unnamed protein product [Adineta steineri]|uniref:Uncharacterized protein n=1 Tax=Adineta steineri TaxID=433720 RepID=A0A815Q538_9BILA|nr:unnamed protein product [Adineta steineri]
MSRNQIGVCDSEPVASNSQQTLTDRSTLLKCSEKKKLWIIISVMIVVLVVTIPIVIIKTKTTNTIKLSTEPRETPTEEFTTTTTDNPSTEVQTKPKYKKWKQHGITIAGGNGQGNQSNQLSSPHGIYIDDNTSILIADRDNKRIVEWKFDSIIGQIIKVGSAGDGLDPLYMPFEVTVDKQKNAIIICDVGIKRVIRWFRENQTNSENLAAGILCGGVTIDQNGSFYSSVWNNHMVVRWKDGDKDAMVVAGGYGPGDDLKQLEKPSFVFVDKDHSVYVSDTGNQRIMKWKKGAKQGIVVAGGNGYGNNFNQLFEPYGVIVDNMGQIFIADCSNHRIMRWREGDTEGSVVVGGNGQGNDPNQLYLPTDLSFDIEGHLYVADTDNHRIQKYELYME